MYLFDKTGFILAFLLTTAAPVSAEQNWLCTTEKFVGYVYTESHGFKEINFDPTKYVIRKTHQTAQGQTSETEVYGLFGMEQDGKPYSTGTGFNDAGVLIMDGWFKTIFNPKTGRFSMVDIGGYALPDDYKHIPTSLAMGHCVADEQQQ